MKAGRFGRSPGTKSCSLWSVAHLTREQCLADATGAFTQRALRFGARPSCPSGCCGDAVQRPIPGTAPRRLGFWSRRGHSGRKSPLLHVAVERAPRSVAEPAAAAPPRASLGSRRSCAPGPSLFSGFCALDGARRGGASRGKSGASRGASGNSYLRPSFSKASHRAGPAAASTARARWTFAVLIYSLFPLAPRPVSPRGALWSAAQAGRLGALALHSLWDMGFPGVRARTSLLSNFSPPRRFPAASERRSMSGPCCPTSTSVRLQLRRAR